MSVTAKESGETDSELRQSHKSFAFFAMTDGKDESRTKEKQGSGTPRDA
jgi:hypothetical protein